VFMHVRELTLIAVTNSLTPSYIADDYDCQLVSDIGRCSLHCS